MVQPASAFFFFTPACSSLVTACRPLFLNHISHHVAKHAQRDGEKRSLSNTKSQDNPGLFVSFFFFFCARFHAGRAVFPASLALEKPRAPDMCRMSNAGALGLSLEDPGLDGWAPGWRSCKQADSLTGEERARFGERAWL